MRTRGIFVLLPSGANFMLKISAFSAKMLTVNYARMCQTFPGLSEEFAQLPGRFGRPTLGSSSLIVACGEKLPQAA